ncbi:MAG TPA: bifunctional diaminohydroxyphosphoribosylaminopyrimidine deaminase/5-amino-6-(5-phosphoribosylamino)uracil reductase RibD [Ignavibacteria bacterium]|nr:bifunctional diaminohydroxyphosphoribosylaminopyrimidine deaminase/5-amino-6-(5-phosphoribosylamino)uracil reductase RibD [Ignavibacteria bacterium]
MTHDEKLIKVCIGLAIKGKGMVSPNPLVGSVVVKNNQIIGKGYHKKFGEAHAERNAVLDAEKKGFNVKGASVYVNLEPCAHVGKTASCAEFLVSKKVKEVIIGMKDPYSKVNGKGIEILIKAGIKVKTGILEKECMDLNKFFINFVTKKLPYVTLKIGQSIDGNIALNNFESKYITGSESRKYVHKMRSEYDAVLIGKNTAIKDDPSLNVRDVTGRDPLRIVIDWNNSLKQNLKIFSDDNKDKTFVITKKSAEKYKGKKNLLFMVKDDRIFKLKSILKLLHGFNVNSVLVEGGSVLFSQFIKENLFDDIYFFIAPKIMGKGISPFDGFEINSLNKTVDLKTEFTKRIGKDILIKYKNCLQV